MGSRVLEAVARHASDHPDRVAFHNRDERLSYGALAAHSDALAAHLAAVMPPGSPAVVLGHKQPEMLVSFLACMKSGRPYVPVDDGIPQARVERILTGSRAALVLAPGDAKLAAAHPAVLDRAAIRDVIAKRLGDTLPANVELGLDDTAYLLYTSGSTGEPKGVEITLANLSGFITWAIEAHDLGRALRYLDPLPYSFDASGLTIYPPLVTGGTIYALDRNQLAKPSDVRRALADSNVQVWTSTPSLLEMCLFDRRIAADLVPGLECIMMGGETLTPALVRRLQDRFPKARIYDQYGPTEATVAVTSLLVDAEVLAKHDSIPLGKPMPKTRLLLLDPDGQVVPDGTIGEIVIEGPCVGRGYLGNPELTARAFSGTGSNRRYRTGDAGCVIEGEMFFRGRLDGQVKLFGRRIELDDIAANLASLPAVAIATAAPVLRDGRCQAIVGFVVLRDGAMETEATLRAGLTPLIPDYMIPREIRICVSLPMTHNGKIDRARVAAELAAEDHAKTERTDG